MTRKFIFGSIAVCILAVVLAVALSFVISPSILANADVTGDIIAGEYYFDLPSTLVFGNAGNNTSISSTTMSIYQSNNTLLGTYTFTYANCWNTGVLVFYLVNNGQSRLRIDTNGISWQTNSGGSWTTQYTNLHVDNFYVSTLNFGVQNAALLGALKSVLSSATLYFDTSHYYTINPDFDFTNSSLWDGSSINLTGDVNVFYNDDYHNWIVNALPFTNQTWTLYRGSNFDMWGLSYDMVSSNRVFDFRLVVDGYRPIDYYEHYDTLRTQFIRTDNGTSTYTFFDGFFPSNRFSIKPNQNNFGLSGTQLQVILHAFIDWDEYYVEHHYAKGTCPTNFSVPDVTLGDVEWLDYPHTLYTIQPLVNGEYNLYYSLEGQSNRVSFFISTTYNDFTDFAQHSTQFDWYNYTAVFAPSIDFDGEELLFLGYILEDDNYVLRYDLCTTYFNDVVDHNNRINSFLESFITRYGDFMHLTGSRNDIPNLMLTIPRVVRTILIGEWDSGEHDYVGGLLSFDILGMNVRVVFLSLVSIIVLLKLISFVIGTRDV